MLKELGVVAKKGRGIGGFDADVSTFNVGLTEIDKFKDYFPRIKHQGALGSIRSWNTAGWIFFYRDLCPRKNSMKCTKELVH